MCDITQHRLLCTNSLAILIVFLLSSCRDFEPQSVFNMKEENEQIVVPCNNCDKTFEHNDIKRKYTLHVPKNLKKNAPLVFYLHGTGADASKLEWMGLNKIADTNGFVVVYPQGLPREAPWWKKGKSIWNSVRPESKPDDLGFLVALAEYLQQVYGLNPDRTFTSGNSNGGFMSYHLVAQRPDVFRASACLNSTVTGVTWRSRNDFSPVPILQVSGALDKVIPVDGSLNKAGWGGAPDTKTIMEFWAELNETKEKEIIQVTPNTLAYKYTGGKNGNEVWYYLIDDYGHGFPLGENGSINSMELIWKFFSKF